MPLSPDTLAYLNASPYFAALEGRDKMGQDLFNAKFEKLPESVRKFLLAPETADGLSALALTQGLDQRYIVAMGKIVASVTLGEVPLGSIQQLLEKVDLAPDQAAIVAQEMSRMLEPVMAAKAQAVVGAKPKEIPPLTRTVGGIIDLRKQKQQ
jgi:hypothetical protein